MNPHSCNSQRILSPSCLPFHHPGSLACIEDRKVPQSYVFLRNSAIISILFAFVVFLGIPCPRLARQGRTLLRISHTQTSQRVSQLRSLFAFSTLLVSRLPLNPQLSTLNHRPLPANVFPCVAARRRFDPRRAADGAGKLWQSGCFTIKTSNVLIFICRVRLLVLCVNC